ncbi:hypothetical protein PQR14_13980 [Paraburkholderia bryophila]|uniref:hypothetical protein n=1 Tax=Paraburkholderia bryophila TaxID=420952 RepID=UPI0038B77912
MSQGAIELDIKAIDDKPAVCLPVSDDTGSDPVRIRRVGVSRATGTVSPDVIYWDVDVPASAQPVYLKRGECLFYGETLPGAIVNTSPKPLDVNKFNGITIMPAGDYGPVYSSAFCVLTQADGTIRVAVPTQVQSPCGSLSF